MVRLQGTSLADAEGRRSGRDRRRTRAACQPHRARGGELWDLTITQLPVPVAIHDREARFVAATRSNT